MPNRTLVRAALAAVLASAALSAQALTLTLTGFAKGSQQLSGTMPDGVGPGTKAIPANGGVGADVGTQSCTSAPTINPI